PTDECPRGHRLERRERERRVETGSGRDGQTPRAEVGVRSRVRDDGESGAGDHVAVREREVEALSLPVVVTKERVERGHDVQRMREVALQRAAALDALDDG